MSLSKKLEHFENVFLRRKESKAKNKRLRRNDLIRKATTNTSKTKNESTTQFLMK